MVTCPWERNQGESSRVYSAFCVYRDLPPHERSLRKAAQRIVETATKPRRFSTVLRQLSEWSSRWQWVERAEAWDDEQDRQARAAQTKAIKDMKERHATEAMALQQKALERLRELRPEELSAGDVLRYLIEAAKLERLSRGEPDVIQEQRGTVTVRGEQNLNIVQRIIADPEARELARRLYDRVGAGRSDAGESGSGEFLQEGDSQPLDTSTSPGVAG